MPSGIYVRKKKKQPKAQPTKQVAKELQSFSKLKAKKWDTLQSLIVDYAEAVVADSWKGGGDPDDIPAVEAYLFYMTARLNSHIAFLKREDE